MKKIIFLFSLATLCLTGYSATRPSSPPLKNIPVKASEVYLPIGKSGELISLFDLSQISVKEMEEFTGKKMKFAEKVNFKLGQRELKKNINEDGSFNSKKFEKYLAAESKSAAGGVHIGGLALGFLLSLIGVLIAYLINDDLKAARVKWAWIGAAIGLVFWLILSAI